MKRQILINPSLSITYHVFLNKSSKNTLVFLHGFLESSFIWEKTIEALRHQYTCISVDLPGHGESQLKDSDNSVSIEQMASIVAQIIEQEQVQNPFVIGHSMGGYVALELARNHPNNIAGICLFFSTAQSDSDQKKENRLRAIEVVKQNKTNFVLQSIPNLFAPENRLHFSDYINKLIKNAENISPQSIILCLRAMMERKDFTNFLYQTTIPVYYIIGKKDPVISFESYLNQIKAPAVKGIRIIENCGHMGYVEAFEDCKEALAGFSETVFTL